MSDLGDLIDHPVARQQLVAHRRRVATLINRGVVLTAPDSVEVGEDIDPGRIFPGVVLHAGTRLRGRRTLLAPGVVIGAEGPTTLEGVVAGHGVSLDGGFYQDCTFLDGSGTRSWSHIRGGCLFEEFSSVAHCVGLKQTILFPFVTLGSLINFCDVLMAGGTSNKDHSEVGSGYIHFNFTPRGDKATPSLFGDVPRGVLLREGRIFLGGMAASVGPMTVGYGSFLGPGHVYRRNVGEGRFQLGERQLQMDIDFDPHLLTGLSGKFRKNFHYLGQLFALFRWYQEARPLLAGGDEIRRVVYAEGLGTVHNAIQERVNQLDKLMAMVPESIHRLKEIGAAERAITEQEKLLAHWPVVKNTLQQHGEIQVEEEHHEAALLALQNADKSRGYVEAIRSLPPEGIVSIRAWLSQVVSRSEAAARLALEG